MNALLRNIERGEVVICRADMVTGDTPAERAFVCEQGFGMQTHTSGAMIFGRWQQDGRQGAIRGSWIDPEETAVYALLGAEPVTLNELLAADGTEYACEDPEPLPVIEPTHRATFSWRGAWQFALAVLGFGGIVLVAVAVALIVRMGR